MLIEVYYNTQDSNISYYNLLIIIKVFNSHLIVEET